MPRPGRYQTNPGLAAVISNVLWVAHIIHCYLPGSLQVVITHLFLDSIGECECRYRSLNEEAYCALTTPSHPRKWKVLFLAVLLSLIR